MRPFYGWKFAATVAFPLFLASVLVAWLTFDLIYRVSAGANEQDRERTREAVMSAFHGAEKQLAAMVTDNSLWDDAVRYVYGATDVAWVEDTWGAPTDPGINYDMMMIVDRDVPHGIAAFRGGKPFEPLIGAYFSGGMAALLDRLPTDNTTHLALSSPMMTQDGLALVAVAPVLPTSSDGPLTVNRPRYLVFAKYLTPAFVKQLGVQYVVDGLRLDPAGQGTQGGLQLKNPSGQPIAAVSWVDRRPGDVAGAGVTKKAAIVLSFLALVILGIGLLCWQLVCKVTERENAARHDATHDALTGLPNRAALHDQINLLSKTELGAVALAFADLDGFKHVNDTYDHETGDRLIRAVAAGLSCLAGDKGKVFRLGGDEFVMLLTGADAEARAVTLAATMIEFLATPFDIGGRMATVGASIGIASVAAGRLASGELMRRADVAMYRAKDNGKNRHCVYDPQFDGDRDNDLRIARDLRAILDQGQLEIAYQPIVDAQSRRVVAVEALARWPSTSTPAVRPDKFIAVAEAHGLIDRLGDGILNKACADLKNWPGIRLAINVSPVQLRNPDFVRRTVTTIANHGLDPRRIELEITESVLVQDIPGAKAMFQQLRDKGFHIALDDFGTGFSSISYLRQFSFDRIKIDKSLIGRMLNGSSEQNVVHGAMLMANGLSAGVTAEGVEREEQVNLLRLCGCDEMQGFYFSKPKPAQDIARMLAEPLLLQSA